MLLIFLTLAIPAGLLWAVAVLRAVFPRRPRVPATTPRLLPARSSHGRRPISLTTLNPKLITP